MSKHIERSGQPGRYSKEELRAKTQHAIGMLETQASINRGERQPTISERRERLRKLEARGAQITTDILKIKTANY